MSRQPITMGVPIKRADSAQPITRCRSYEIAVLPRYVTRIGLSVAENRDCRGKWMFGKSRPRTQDGDYRLLAVAKFGFGFPICLSGFGCGFLGIGSPIPKMADGYGSGGVVGPMCFSGPVGFEFGKEVVQIGIGELIAVHGCFLFDLLWFLAPAIKSDWCSFSDPCFKMDWAKPALKAGCNLSFGIAYTVLL